MQQHSVRKPRLHNVVYQFIFIVTLLLGAFPVTAIEVDDLNFKGQLSLNYIGTDTAATGGNQAILRYIPDMTLQKSFDEDSLWDFNISANLMADYEDHPDTDHSSTAELYRLNTQFETAHSDTRLGLQQINFGPAVILRSLRWFDQVSPTDPLELTEGVTGIRYRFFFLNNANIWLWALYDNNDPKGYERIATKKHTPEVGARFQYPLSVGELGVSIHGRKTEGTGFSDTAIEETLVEKRIAIDGKFDLGPGLWYEYVLIDQGAGSAVDTNWFSMLTLGADNTIAMGNGIRVLVEHLINANADKAMEWDQRTQSSALQFSYPVGVLDSISLMAIYAWTDEQEFHYLRWDRTYDNWAFNVAVFLSPDQSSDNRDLATSGLSGNGIQAVMVFNH